MDLIKFVTVPEHLHAEFLALPSYSSLLVVFGGVWGGGDTNCYIIEYHFHQVHTQMKLKSSASRQLKSL